MGAITFSGFNQIDFNVILKAVMEQERQPLVALQNRRTALESQREAFATLATRLGAVEAAAGALADANAFGARSTTISDPTVASAAASSSTPPGVYEVVINALARSQVTTTATTYADRDTTVVATGGTLTIDGVAVVVPGAVTLQALADAINTTPNISVTATIVAAAGRHQMVLTGKSTGAANAFTVSSELTGGEGLAFSETNAVDASDADVLVNNVRVTSETNALEGAIPGTTLTLLKQTAAPVTVAVGRDLGKVEEALESFITAYNDLVKFFNDQNASAAEGRAASIGRDAITRSLRSALRDSLTAPYGTGGFQYLSQIGVTLDRTGTLRLDRAAFDAAATDLPRLEAFVAGTGASGAFDAIRSIVKDYVRSDGLVPGARSRLNDEMQRLDDRMANLEARLALRQQSLTREYAATDALISSLNGQGGALSSLGGQYSLF
jgi:flagellar hook-associated protein 2